MMCHEDSAGVHGCTKSPFFCGSEATDNCCLGPVFWSNRTKGLFGSEGNFGDKIFSRRQFLVKRFVWVLIFGWFSGEHFWLNKVCSGYHIW